MKNTTQQQPSPENQNKNTVIFQPAFAQQKTEQVLKQSESCGTCGGRTQGPITGMNCTPEYCMFYGKN